MHRIFRVKAYEAEHGPHFNEEHARKAVSKMENEDGTRGPHWSVEETTALASQYGINLGSRFNRYDWFVALNMVYSDYYKVIISMTNSNSTKHFVELAKAWIMIKTLMKVRCGTTIFTLCVIRSDKLKWNAMRKKLKSVTNTKMMMMTNLNVQAYSVEVVEEVA